MMASGFEQNPRIFIGANGPPDEDDASEPTLEEARVVAAAVSYLQFKVPDITEILTKRKGGRVLGWRLALTNCLKGRVRQNSLRLIIGYNRKTMGENQQRADMWAEHDEEHGDGSFGDLMERLRHAIEADYQVDAPALETKLKAYVKLDPDLRKLEEQKRLHEAAAAEAEAQAQNLERQAKDKKRAIQASEVAKALKGVKGAGSIVAEHMGPKRLAKVLSDSALAVVEKLVKAEAKGARRKASDLDRAGLKECLDKGLARIVQPYLAPMPEDPEISLTDLCQRVFVEAVELKRLKVKKRKAA